MRGKVEGGYITATIPKLHGEVTLRWRIVKWINGPNKGFVEAEYEGRGRWNGPRCQVVTEICNG